MICKVCSSDAMPFATAQVLNRHNVEYFRCRHCGVVQTEEPYWIKEAYSAAITRSDVGLVSRNIHLSLVCRSIITFFFSHEGKYVDYGGGYGLFVRLMRDCGFAFFRYDKYCENLFAEGFDADLAREGRYELVTAFEVFEHLVEPITSIEEMLALSDSILFSTVLIPEDHPKPGAWWYYGLEHGQHLVLYTAKSLALLGERLELNLYSKSSKLHLLTKKRISPLLFEVAASHRLGVWLGHSRKSRSLLETDYAKTTGMMRNPEEL
jgi:hypothetical protein